MVDSTSGWFAHKKSDFISLHIYFKLAPIQDSKKPVIISECGGYSQEIKDHFFSKYNHYGYGSCKTKEELTGKVVEMYQRMVIPAIEKGLCGCIYTQLSDVEDETNGFYTYDRKVCKVDKEQIQKIYDEIRTQFVEN